MLRFVLWSTALLRFGPLKLEGPFRRHSFRRGYSRLLRNDHQRYLDIWRCRVGHEGTRMLHPIMSL
ncbi:hypothetical protein ASD81_17330 [Nocardioides sp. Root614]|nr:hypothetical protein ASD81_17330 [Nocardioides sp. Root614]KRA87846.1 hypothetical protein ASD84_17600 [Nocardioides sp. Root682]